MALINLDMITPKGVLGESRKQPEVDLSKLQNLPPVPRGIGGIRKQPNVDLSRVQDLPPFVPDPEQPTQFAQEQQADLTNLFNNGYDPQAVLSEITAIAPEITDSGIIDRHTISAGRLAELAPVVNDLIANGSLNPEHADVVRKVAAHKFYQNEGTNVREPGSYARGSLVGVGKFVDSAVDSFEWALNKLNQQTENVTATIFGDDAKTLTKFDLGDDLGENLGKALAYSEDESYKLEQVLAGDTLKFGEQLGGAYAMGAATGALNSIRGVQALSKMGKSGMIARAAIVDGIPAFINTVNDSSFIGEALGVDPESMTGKLIGFAENTVLGASADALFTAIGTSVRGRAVKVTTEDQKRKIVEYSKKYLDNDYVLRETAHKRGETKEQFLERVNRVAAEARAVQKTQNPADAARLEDSADQAIPEDVAIAREYTKSREELDAVVGAVDETPIKRETVPKRPGDYYKSDPSMEIRRAVNDYLEIPQASKAQVAKAKQASEATEDLDHLFEDPPKLETLDMPKTQAAVDKAKTAVEHNPLVPGSVYVKQEQLALPAPKDTATPARRVEAEVKAKAAAKGSVGEGVVPVEGPTSPVAVGETVTYKGDTYEVSRIGKGRATIRSASGKPKVVKVESLEKVATDGGTVVPADLRDRIKRGTVTEADDDLLDQIRDRVIADTKVSIKEPKKILSAKGKYTELEAPVVIGNYGEVIGVKKLPDGSIGTVDAKGRLTGQSFESWEALEAAASKTAGRKKWAGIVDGLDRPTAREPRMSVLDAVSGEGLHISPKGRAFVKRLERELTKDFGADGAEYALTSEAMEDVTNYYNSIGPDETIALLKRRYSEDMPDVFKTEAPLKVEMVSDPHPGAVHKEVPVKDDSGLAAQSADQALEVPAGKTADDLDQRPAADKDPTGVLPDTEMPIGNIYETLAESKLQSSVKVGSYVGPSGKLRTITISKPDPSGRVTVSTGEPSSKVRSKLFTPFTKRDTLDSVLRRLEVEQGVTSVVWDPAVLPADAREVVRSLQALGIRHLPEVENAADAAHKLLGRSNGTTMQMVREMLQDTRIRIKNLERGLYDQYADPSSSVYAQMRLSALRAIPELSQTMARYKRITTSGLERVSTTLDIPPAEAKTAIERYLHAKRAVEVNPRVGDGGTGMLTSDAEEIIRKAPPVVAEEASRLQRLTVEILDNMVESGYITKATRDDLVEKNRDYIPLTRVMDDLRARRLSLEYVKDGESRVLGSKDTVDTILAQRITEVEGLREGYVRDMKLRRPKATLATLRKEARLKFKTPKRADIRKRLARELKRGELETEATALDAGILDADVDPDTFVASVMDSMKSIRGSSRQIVSPYETIPTMLAQSIRLKHNNRWAQVLANNVRKNPLEYGMDVVAKPETVQRALGETRKLVYKNRREYTRELIRTGEKPGAARLRAIEEFPLPNETQLEKALRASEMRQGELTKGLRNVDGVLKDVEPSYVKVYEDGVPKYIVAREPHGAFALEAAMKYGNGLKIPENKLLDISLGLRKVYAALLTYMPAFMVTQKTRDLQDLMFKLGTDLDLGAGGSAVMNTAGDSADLFRLSKYLKLAETDKAAADAFVNSLDAGARGGFDTTLRAYNNGALAGGNRFIAANDFGNSMKKTLKDIQATEKAAGRNPRWKLFKHVRDTIENSWEFYTRANFILENGARKSTYAEFTARGFSDELATLKSRDITYDPLQRGVLAPYLSLFSTFANPALQGSWSSFYSLSRGASMTPGDVQRAGIRGASMAVGVLLPMTIAAKLWNAVMFPEASERVNSWDESSGVSVIMGEDEDGRPLTIKAPTPHNHAIIQAFLNVTVDKMLGVKRPDGYDREVMWSASAMSADPVGLSRGVGVIIPDMLRPVVEVATNYDFFTKRPIANANAEVDAANYGRMDEQGGLDTLLVRITDSLYKAGVDVNPKNVRQLLKGWFGGQYREIDNIADAVTSRGTWNASKLPALSGVVRDGISEADYETYYKNRGLENELKTLRADSEMARKKVRDAAKKWAEAYNAGGRDAATEYADRVQPLLDDPEVGAAHKAYFNSVVRRNLGGQMNSEVAVFRKFSDRQQRAKAVMHIIETRKLLDDKPRLNEWLQTLQAGGVFDRNTIIHFNALMQAKLSEEQ